MRRLTTWILVLGAFVLGTNRASADVIILLQAFHSNGQPISGPVAPGTSATVDLLLLVDPQADPVEDVRFIQFDFDATDETIALVAFTWTVDEAGYSFVDPDLPITNVTSIMLMSTPELLVLTQQPVKVATVDIVINGSGRLDSINKTNTFDDYGADVRAGFDLQERFNAMMGNLQGGLLSFAVSSTGGGDPDADQDGDGVLDVDDAFPNDPNETTDTDGNGVGDNADPDDDGDGVPDDIDADPLDPNVGEVGGNGNVNGNTNDNTNSNSNNNDNSNSNNNDNGNGGGAGAPRACGAGMLGSGLFMLVGLGLMSLGSRRRAS